MKEKKLLRALGNVDNQYIKEAEPMKKTSKITNRQKWVSVAACFVLVAVIGVGVFQSNLFGTKNDIATLNDGETITFVKNDLSQSSINLNVTTRPLSDAEIEMLFADLPVTADAYFDADNHNILGFEGKIDDTRMVVSKQGVNLLDTRRLQRCISPLCGSVGCLLDFPLARRTGRFLRLFRQRKSLPSYFFILL